MNSHRTLAGRLTVAIALAALTTAAAGAWTQATGVQSATIPARLTDAEFWALSELASEPNGEFQSDNFLSNERGMQVVIPQLVTTAKPGRVYLGVGPEQNFPYILAIKPAIAIIFDVRRGNLHEHLLYKAIFELSADRADFLARLFSRKRPEGLTRTSSVDALMSAFDAVPPSPELYQANLADVTRHLTKTHGFALHDDDIPGIDYVYRTAFYTGGPRLTYNMAGRGARGGGGGGGGGGTYWDMQMLDDGTGVNRGFLATEESWAAMKEFESRNLLVPVVGDFGGTKAIRTVGKYLKEHGKVVSAFYLSNVEQYLNRSGTEQAFLCNVATLPLDETSTFIFTGGGRYGAPGGFGGGGGGGGGGGRGGGLNTTFLRPMQPDTQGCGG